MIGWFIVACEIGFWVFIITGLLFRYILKKPKISIFFLAGTPVLDLVLLIATAYDLRRGAVASFMHGLAAIYLAVSVVYGRSMVRWADKQFAYRFAGGEKPVKVQKYGAEHAKEERKGWYLHALTWLIGCAIMAAMVLTIDGSKLGPFFDVIRSGMEPPSLETLATFALIRTMTTWTIILAVDFVISFSYTIFPKKEPTT